MYAALRKIVTGDDMKVQYQARAKMLVVKPQEPTLPKHQRLPGTVFVVSAGPEDQVAADQVKIAAEHFGCYVIAKQQLSTRDVGKLMEQAQGGLWVACAHGRGPLGRQYIQHVGGEACGLHTVHMTVFVTKGLFTPAFP